MKKFSLIFIVLFLFPQISFGAYLNLLGVEDGTTNDSQAVAGTNSIVTSPVRTGTYAFRTNPTTTGTGSMTFSPYSSAGAQGSGNGATYSACTAFQYATKPAQGDEIFAGTMGTAGVAKLALSLSYTGQIVMIAADSTTILGTSTTALSSDTWYDICFISRTGTINHDVYINGVSEITGATIDANNNIRVFWGKRVNRNGQSVDYYFDDLVFSGDDSIVQNGAKVDMLVPDGAGTYTGWTEGTGNTFAEVDDVPKDDDTTYIMTTAFATSTFAMTASTFAAGSTILTTGPLSLVRDVGGASSHRLYMISGATETNETAARNLSTTYSSIGNVRDTDPNTAVAWTQSGVDAVEVGVRSVAAVEARATAIYFKIAYIVPTPAAGATNIPHAILQGGLQLNGQMIIQ